MCLPLLARVLGTEGNLARVELLGGEVVRVNPALHPGVTAGDHVLLDRGLIVEVIDARQVEEILGFYTELEQLWAEEDTEEDIEP